MDKQLQKLKEIYIILTMIEKDSVPCRYCGAPATDKEHIIPKSFIEKLEAMRQNGIEVEIPENNTVPSCRECNDIAGDKIFKNFKEKKQFIKDRIKQKYKKILNSPDWSDEEISVLGVNLRQMVYFNQRLKELIKKRLSY